MVKHIVTPRCPQNCGYCLTKNIRESQDYDLKNVSKSYEMLSRVEDSIMLTGGEPTIARRFPQIVELAHKYFKEVYITTQNKVALKDSYFKEKFNAITFSLHQHNFRFESTPLKVENGQRVYGAILPELFRPNVIALLQYWGFAGVTINEEKRSQVRFDESILTQYKAIYPHFSIRVNRFEKCLRHENILLPDLSWIKDFRPYLGKEQEDERR